MSETTSPYSTSFFETNVGSSGPSAKAVLQHVFDLLPVTSIVDIGCGSGAWLAAAESLGCRVLKGYDGPWADPRRFTSPNIDFSAVDMEQSDFELERTYDLAVSVEVAEHLTESRADFIVDKLCAAAPVVLFGAAIPHQGGVHHVHERPQSYWIEKFRERGFECYDVIRPAIWTNNEVKWWFQQNTFLFVRVDNDDLDRGRLHEFERPIWDLVHPRNFGDRAGQARARSKEVAELQRRVKELSAQNRAADAKLAKARERAQRLERKIDTMRPARRTLRTVGPKDLPEPLRPIAARVWQALPNSARGAIRRR